MKGMLHTGRWAIFCLLIFPMIVVAQQPQASSPARAKTTEYLAFEPVPFETRGTLMVPLRQIADWLGAQVNAETSKIIVSKDSTTLTVKFGSTSASLNGQPFALPVPITANRDVTFVPLRPVCEAFGGTATWSAEERLFIITTATKKAKIVGATMPNGQGDILWLTSVPLGARVYVDIPTNAAFAQEESFVGTTPTVVKMRPGEHTISVVIPLSVWGLGKPRRIPLPRGVREFKGFAPTSEGALRKYVQECVEAFERLGSGSWQAYEAGDEQVYGDGRVTKLYVRIGSIGQVFKADKAEGTGVKVWGLQRPPAENPDGQQANLVVLFQRAGKPLSELERLLPAGTNFRFDDKRMAGVLHKRGVEARSVPAILGILHRGGKVVCRGSKGKMVVEITGDNKWMVTSR